MSGFGVFDVLLNRTSKNRNVQSMQKTSADTEKSNNKILYVKESHIHGKGLFAKRNIKQGQVIGYIKGTPTTADGPHVLWLNGTEEGVVVECDLKYINHNSNPNACYYDDLTVVALRDIEKDEEITHHYGEDWNEDNE